MRSIARMLAAASLLLLPVHPGTAADTTFALEESVRTGVPPLYLDIRPNSTFPIELGSTAIFRNDGLIPHTLEEENGLFRWGPIQPGEELGFLPWAVGTYTIRDADRLPGETEAATFGVPAPHPQGRLLRGSVCPPGGEMVVAYDLSWATGPAPGDFVYDVQITEAGEEGWRWLEQGTVDPTGRMEVTAVSDGTPHHMHLRARLRHRDDASRATGWSPQMNQPHAALQCPPERAEARQV